MGDGVICDGWRGQMLQQAVLYDNVDFLECLLGGEEIDNINSCDACGRTATYTAVSNNSLKCLKLLLEHGADPDIAAGVRCQNMTPLHLAVLDCKQEAVRLLLQFGGSLTSTDESGQTPLSLAREISNVNAYALLTAEQEKRADHIKKYSASLCRACSSGNLNAVKEILAECGTNKMQVLNTIPDHDLPPLCSASRVGSLELVQLLLKNGAAPVCQRGSGLSPIHFACDAGHLPVVQLLLMEYPDLAMARSVEHRLPLHIAAANRNVEILKCLLSHSYPDMLQQTFQHKASEHYYKAGFDINAQDSSGKMALHIACEHGLVENVKVLLDFTVEVVSNSTGSDTFPQQNEDVTDKASSLPCSRQPSWVSESESRDSYPTCSTHTIQESGVHHVLNQDSAATSGENLSSIEERDGRVIVHPAVLNVASSEGLAPLHYAIKKHHPDVVRLLLCSGADPQQPAVCNELTFTPIMYTYQHLDLENMELLLQHRAEDVDNKVLMGAFMSQDHNVVNLLLQFKASRDPVHAINKAEMRRLTGQSGISGPESPEHIASSEPEMRLKFPVSPIAVQWQGLCSLHDVDLTCLAQASRHLNPALKLLQPALALCAITKIDISHNAFQSFPVSLFMLPSVVVIDASSNQIREIREEEDNFFTAPLSSSLEEIRLSQNKLSSIPAYLFRLPGLKFLDLSYNTINELPPEMWLAPSLVTLILTRNELSELPLIFRDPHTSISRKMSQHIKRPSMCSAVPSLGPRRCSGSLSSSDADLSMSVFDLSSESGDIILVSHGNVSSNEVIHVNRWSNSIKVVDKDPWKGAGGQGGLKQLVLSKNRFTVFPSSLPCYAQNLEVLDISDNQLENVPSIVDLPASLTELNLSRCGLKTLQPWSDTLEVQQETSCLAVSRLGAFSPHNTSINTSNSSPSSRGISPSIASRESYNSLTAVLCTHCSHTRLGRLEKLNLAHNKLVKVVLTRSADGQMANADTQSIIGLESEFIQSRLLFPNLSELDLSMNLLHNLTSDIGEQLNLRVFSLRGNRYLRELPPKLGLLTKLWKLDLELCPLDGAIQDFVHNSRYPVKDILGFLLSVLEESTYYNSLNLMLVGCHKIGKTSLLQRLRKEGKAPMKPTHWSDRVSSEERNVSRHTTLSTVGIDINELIFDCGGKGSVVFRTWDFGGQREYYATHQYFLSPRSLYLVMWNLIDGERGVDGLHQWLINIQARAPSACVIIVGTHVDVLRDKATRRNFPPDFEEAMVGMVEKLFLGNKEPDKCGLPNILGTINVSCKTGENIRKLVDMIKTNVFEMRHPKSRTVKLLGQKIPRKYLLLQTVVQELAMERIREFKDPVLNRSKYMLCVSDKMMEKGYTTFRDVEELEQATRFLHENGVLFHWDDVALRDLYFLNPQWLCDQLAWVVTIPEINGFARKGVMEIQHLEFLFRKSPLQSESIHQYFTSLLAKFEVALQYDEQHLLLPSLLPQFRDPTNGKQEDTRIPVRKPVVSERPDSNSSRISRWCDLSNDQSISLSSRHRAESGPEELHIGYSVFYAGSQVTRELQQPRNCSESSSLLLLAIKPYSNPIFSFCRLYFMTYFPSGFWSRLIVRILADSSLYPVVKSLFHLPSQLLNKSADVRLLMDRDPEWHCWQTGLELFYLGFEMMRIREIIYSNDMEQHLCNYNQCRLKCSVEKEWCFLDMANSRMLEITFPIDLLRFHVSSRDGPTLQRLDVANMTTVVREEQATARLLVKVVEHIDNLLQDWFPELGELRFSQNCEGRYLVTRVVPCPQCLAKEVNRQKSSRKEDDSWFFVNMDMPDLYTPFILPHDTMQRHEEAQPVASGLAITPQDPHGRARDVQPRWVDITRCIEDYTFVNKMSVTRRSIADGQALIYNRENSQENGESIIYCYMVERCMLDVLQGKDAVCPLHGSISPQHLLDSEGVSHPFYIAPDVVFNDLDHQVRISNTDQIEVGTCLGEGNFGKVYEGCLFKKGEGAPQAVALKILFEPENNRKSTHQGFQTRLEAACTAYLTARQEVSILEGLSHPHIVPFMGLALRPLSLVLGLAPHGALDSVLKKLHGSGTHLPLFVIRQIILQVAKALSYLHSYNIIYRDLKSENVLVWDLPSSSDAKPDARINIKIADYGISRTVLPTGARGFGGTPPFIAPEILRFAGKGTYTEKVDIFSLGMFIFELLTCRMPFAEMNNPSSLVCQGGRPSLTTQEVQCYPTCLLDLLSVCWSQEPGDRPSAAGVVNMVTSPQFCHLRDVLSLGPDVGIFCGVSVPPSEISLDENPEPSNSSSLDHFTHIRPAQVWLSSCTAGSTNALEILSFGPSCDTVIDHKTLLLRAVSITALCIVGNYVWCADTNGGIHIYCINTLTLTNKLQLPVQACVSVLSLHQLPGEETVMVVASLTDCGIIFCCQQPYLEPTASEIGIKQFRVFRCYCSSLVSTDDGCELWLGQGSGSILIWNVTSQTTTGCLYHSLDHLPQSTCCFFLVAAKPLGAQHTFVWSYNFPGTVVYCWNSSRRCIVERLDCSTIFSTVDSTILGSPQNPEGSQVTALNIIDRYLYIGNTKGRIIVADAITLQPLCLFPAHSPRDFYIKCILSISSRQDHVFEADQASRSKGVVSVGRGYVDLLSSGGAGVRKRESLGEQERNQSRPGDGLVNHTYVLSWSAENWEYY